MRCSSIEYVLWFKVMISIDSSVGSSGGKANRQYEKNNLRNFQRISDVIFPDGYRTARPSIHPLRDNADITE